MTPQAYIETRSIPEPNSGCWIWSGACTPVGYGFANPPDAPKRNELAHRASYRIFRGKIPPKMLIAHKCDNPSCVNPDHLWLATYKQNSQDMVGKRRAATGEKHGSSKLTVDDVRKIRASSLPNRALGKMYGVSHANIGYIKRGKTWRI